MEDYPFTQDTYLFHKTITSRLESIAKSGLQASDPKNPVEQILEYFRQKRYPDKPSRMHSIFFVTTLATYFLTDMGFFGELTIVLAIRFKPNVLKWFQFYEYDHWKLMEIWRRIAPRIHSWYPDVWESSVVLKEPEINALINWEDEFYYRKIRGLLEDFWQGVKPWDFQCKHNRALYCRQSTPPDLSAYMIYIQQVFYKESWPKKRLVRKIKST
jgi:hypothetical protein